MGRWLRFLVCGWRMPDSDFPIVSSPPPPQGAPAPSGDGAERGTAVPDTSSSLARKSDRFRRARRRWSGLPWARVAGVCVALAAGLLVVLGLAALLGEDFRNAVLVEVDRSLAGSEVSYSDAPAEAALFFAERDSLTIRIPWDMTAGELLALYHLETNASARAALRDQLGVVSDSDPLREGDRVTLNLTLTRPEP